MEKITLLTFFELVISKIRACFLSKNIVSSLSFFMPISDHAKRYSHNGVSKSWCWGFLILFRNMAVLLSICCIFFSSQIFGQFANVNPPTGGFAIDGGLRANTPTSPSPFAANQGDWYPGATDSGSGGSVFYNNGGVISPATNDTSGRAPAEAYNGNDNIFTEGSKFNDYVSVLKWFTNSAPNKNDINNALFHISRDANDDQWIFISGDRLSPDGTSYIDFELLQGDIDQNSDGTFTGTPATGKNNGGGRTENDIIISMEYSSGGTKPKVFIYQWKESIIKGKLVWSYVQVTSTTELLANAFAETNRTGVELEVPYLAFGSNTYQQFAFVEAGINISYLLQLTGKTCSGLNIKTLWVKTKASDSSTAALKDFITPIPVDLIFGTTKITPIAAKCADDSKAYELIAEPSGGTFSGAGVSGTGPYYFTPSIAGAADSPHEITYLSADESCEGSIEIVVNAQPSVSNATAKFCSDVQSDTTLSDYDDNIGTGTGESVVWYSDPRRASDDIITTTGDLTVGDHTYYARVTNDGTDCYADAELTITINSNPVPSVDDEAECVGATATFSTTNLGTGFKYQWYLNGGSIGGATSNTYTTDELTSNDDGNVYKVIVTDENNDTNCTGEDSGTLTINANPDLKLKLTQPSLCGSSTGSIEVCNPVAGTYSLFLDGVLEKNIVFPDDPVIFTDLKAGSKPTVTVVTTAGCTATSTCDDAETEDCPIIPAQTAKTSKAIVPMEAKTEKVGFDAYPVPFKNILNIKYNFDYVSNVRIDVFNSQGVLVLSKNDTNSYLNKEVALDLKTNNGQGQVYIVKLTTDRGSSVKKIISSR